MKKSVFTLILLMTLALTLIPVPAQPATEPTFAAMMGKVESYGENPAYGWLGALAEVEKWAEVKIIWTVSMPHILVFPANYAFYAARLVESDMVELGYNGNDFYVNGTWDVYNITIMYGAGRNLKGKIVKLVVDKGPGALSVFNNWTDFTVDIEGIEMIKGIVLRYCTRIFPIPPGDSNLDGKVDIFDLVHVAKAYGTTPGIGKYNLDTDVSVSVDINFDFVVDIYDLTTIAANLGENY